MPLHLQPGAWIFLEEQHRYGGSLGLPVRSDDGRQFLTAAHVVGALARAHGRTNRVYTSALGPVPVASVLIGHAGRSEPPTRRRVCPVDAALVTPLERVDCNRDIGEELKAHGGYFTDIYDDALYELTVFKRGAKTGVTRGVIVEIGAQLTTKQQGRQRPIHYPFGYWVMSDEDGKAFAMPGDSGSVVVTGDGRVVGMVVAMQDAPGDPSALAFVIPIRPILEALDVVLIGPRPIGVN